MAKFVRLPDDRIVNADAISYIKTDSNSTEIYMAGAGGAPPITIRSPLSPEILRELGITLPRAKK